MTKNAGQVEITFRYRRHVGPTNLHGGLTLRFDSQQPYSFVSHAGWPDKLNYEASIREAVENVLCERLGNLETTSVTLTEIEWDEIASCEIGFRRAAAAATRAAFDV